MKRWKEIMTGHIRPHGLILDTRKKLDYGIATLPVNWPILTKCGMNVIQMKGTPNE
jgi:hypothetical protein